MPVNTPCAEYVEHLGKWMRCRDVCEGGDAVKAKGETYLPKLDVHLGDPRGPAKYEAYKARAVFYNATGRTVEGLSGAVFQKSPSFTLPERIKDHAKDITLAGISAELFALTATREVLSPGRYGVLVDMAVDPKPNDRPYWIAYRTEQILYWHTTRVGGDEVLTQVRLSERVEEIDIKDPFVTKRVDQIRVLELTAEGYSQTRYRKVENRLGAREEWQPYAEAGQEATVYPMRRGVRLDFIPFVFLGPTSTAAACEKPPLLDLVDVNLSHYRTSADLEHGLHHVGTPMLVLIGTTDETGIKYGASNALLVPAGGDAKILQVDGEMFGALERADERKRKLMATLGARLLEEQAGAQETATAVGMRHSGEHATLRTVAQAVEQGLTMAWQFHGWWLGTEAKPADVKVSMELSKEFWALKASPDEVRAAMLLWQGEGISFETFYERLQAGGWARPGVSAEEEQKAIEEERLAGEPEPDDDANPDDVNPDNQGAVPPGQRTPPDPNLNPAMRAQQEKLRK